MIMADSVLKWQSRIHAFIATQLLPGQYIFRSLSHNPITDHSYHERRS